MVVWHCRKYLDTQYLLFLGIAYLFVAGIDSLHTLTYKGMGVFQSQDPNIPTQLWISARYLQSLSLLIAPFFLRRNWRPAVLFGGYFLVTSAIVTSIFYWHVFPDCFIEGVGLTPFKKVSEYLICFILLASVFLLIIKRQAFEKKVLNLLVCSILLTMVSELAFTFYVSVFGLSNLLGHYFKILSSYLIYKAVIETGLVNPYDLLFRDLQVSEKKFRIAFEEAKDAIVWANAETGRIVNCNKAAEALFGKDREEVTGQHMTSFYPSAKADYYACRFRDHVGRKEADEEAEIITKGGQIIPVRLTASVTNLGGEPVIQVIFRDISERRKMERDLQQSHDLLERRVEERTQELKVAHAQLLHAEKLSAAGKLTASIAHELNNPLFGIRNVLAGIKRRAALEKEDEELVAIALQECDRIKYMIQDLQNFNRPTSGVMAPVDIHQAIESILLLLKKELKNKKIWIERKYAENLPIIRAVSDQLKQVIINLLMNAAHAMKDTGGTITITTAILSDDMVGIQVRDTGTGIDSHNLRRIFEPFFTTKPETEGTGLGLSVSHGIIKRHGGRMKVESEVGKGSAFTVLLPVGGKHGEQKVA